jgi:hypothetical protein
MDDASFVGGLKPIGDLACDRKSLSQWNGTLFDALCQGWSFDQFHDQVIRSNVEQRANVRVVNGRDAAGLSLKALTETLG